MKNKSMETAKKTATSQQTRTQLDAVKNRAQELWGERWLIQLCYEYAETLGLDKRSKTSLVQRWFNGDHAPNLDNFNTLLNAVGCKVSITCTEVKQIL